MTVYEKMYPSSHKTVFVLDHTPYFGISCECQIEFDFSKSRGPGFIPLAPISKSLWTCSVEAAVEYCRIAWDLFPQGKLIRFVVSDTSAHTLNTWSQQQQNLTHILNGTAAVGVPARAHQSSEYSVIHGLRAAIEALCECSDIQHEKRTSLTENAAKVLNRCRVICITSARDNASMKSLEDIFQNVLIQQNKIAAASDHLITVHHCHLVIINVYPNNVESQVTGHPPRDLSAILTSEVHSVKAGGQIASKLTHLILSHYDLASTTVTGIPMKEEQNASSSANYDVEIFHSSAAHTSILKGNAADSAMIRTQREGAEYETVTLKWCTPRGCSAAEMQNCTATHRITPVDVNSRPSSCLINFLLNGRSVMLEMPRKTGGKIISHLLAAHGGEIFVHTLVTARSVLEDPPSISEGCGGRVTDYRITDFGVLMQNNKLIPLKRKYDETEPETPLDKMRARLDRHTKYWPITISSTLIFNLRMYIDPLPQLMVKEELTNEEVVQCKQVIYNLIGLESKHENLQTPNMGQRGKGPKREEQYRIMWNELETFLRAHCRSEQHSRVLNCLLECRNKSPDDDKTKAEKPGDIVELDEALRELDQFGKLGETSSEFSSRATVIRATTDSPMSPPPASATVGIVSTTRVPPVGHRSAAVGSSIYSGPRTFLDVWVERVASRSDTKLEFSGRLSGDPLPGGGSIARLYPNVKDASESRTGGNRGAEIVGDGDGTGDVASVT
ncbi:integrator complex subunit 13 isoform X2 [Schistocerca americana]|uniref:integrator complex subunit 13 isoform X2 n=1 Tax=Schistocerca americana TaxID=7009 RepID=UPI001F4F47EB|nr:integrator complex subunit 13 isoform X2 [Schistocerca americana]XP_047107078.1 integrator complex subunit 13 isoform X2 [Schistocerca piceifrons]XP_049774772.1 integrator complex subunit 13 isoform X1 [Schistocerca cancellata]